MSQSLLSALRDLEEAHQQAVTRADFNELWNKVQWIDALSAASRRDQGEADAVTALKVAVTDAIHAHRGGLSPPEGFSAKVSTMEQAVRRKSGACQIPTV